MSEAPVSEETIGRLRANAARAGITLTDEDVARFAGGMFLRNVDAFVRLVERTPPDTIPDDLKDWNDASLADAGSGEQPGAASVAASADPRDPFAPLYQVAEAIAARDVSPSELTELMLERIARHDPALNAYQVVLADEARAAAEEAGREIAAGRYRGPFHGVPFAVKDLLATAGIATTAGSKILGDWVPDEDSAAVRRLKEAGAVLIGKTKMSEFAYSPSSLNVHYGSTHNPWNLDRDTGGSSSGSAAAVAAGLTYGALGSDTGCSIRTPSALCGIVGLKPTFGRLSLAGAVTLSWSLDHLGPMVRSVRDAALILNQLAGHDPADRRTRRGPVPDFTAGLDRADAVRGLRIGAIRDDGSPGGPPDAEATAAWEAGLRALADAGAEIVDLSLPELEDLRVIGSPIINLEAAAYHERNLRERPQDLGQFPRDRLMVGYAYGPIAYVQAQQTRAVLRARLDRVWEQVDLLSSPALAYGAPPLSEPRSNTRYSIPFNALGWPAVVVPSGLTGDGLPLSTQIIGRPWDEARVLRAGRIVERDGPWQGRRPAGY
jgi:aspartyl-tRNA(Asn)/glutamyl-tRNA(Gln) amidotransferase subunit A